jgi:hypothetical protein
MPLDLDAIAPAARARQIKLGQGFSSQDTLDQANQTLLALAEHGAILTQYGFVAKDTQQLTDARDLLVAAGVGREAAHGKNKVTSQTLADALTNGQSSRLRARVILTGVQEDLEDSGTADAERMVKAALQQTSTTPDTAEGMATQLDLLTETLRRAEISELANERGAITAIAGLIMAGSGLRNADQSRPAGRGTPAETQRLDQIDGIIVRLTRRARKVAVVAARDLGNPALAHAFRLDKLYRTRGSTTPGAGDGQELDDGEDGEGEGGTE